MLPQGASGVAAGEHVRLHVVQEGNHLSSGMAQAFVPLQEKGTSSKKENMLFQFVAKAKKQGETINNPKKSSPGV